MRVGERIALGKGEWVTCVTSGEEGPLFEFELEMDPGTDGPPTHVHPDEETFEVTEGEVEFVVDGAVRLLRAGDRLVIPAGTPHTFRVPKGGGRLRGIGRNGVRFERLVEQHAGPSGFLRMARYAHEVDPQASWMVSPLVRAVLALAAFVARLRGVAPYAGQPLPAGAP